MRPPPFCRAPNRGTRRGMRFLLLSDIHADAGALEAVLRHAQTRGWDHLIFLGDAVGRGDEPEAVVSSLAALKPYAALRGNHEAALLAALEPGAPNLGTQAPGAASPGYGSARDHAQRLSEPNLAFLRDLKEVHLDTSWGAVHGALRRPFEYLASVPVARANQPLMQRPLYLVGHTHAPAVFSLGRAGGWRGVAFRAAATTFELPPGAATFFNPGAVSGPRDGVAAASYAIFDEPRGRFEVFRLPLVE
jgi:predicted phosphodiesterase